jgi:hypothetical protein
MGGRSWQDWEAAVSPGGELGHRLHEAREAPESAPGLHDVWGDTHKRWANQDSSAFPQLTPIPQNLAVQYRNILRYVYRES